MKKGINKMVVFALCFLSGIPVFSQLTISGPVCVVPGVTYEYTLSHIEDTAVLATMQVCVNGGIIADQDPAKRNACSETGAPLSAILIEWNDQSGTSVTLSCSAGNTTLQVTITSALEPGLIDSSNQVQDFSDTVTIPTPILCSAAEGGSCSPNYVYQWQRSNDVLVWTDIEGSTSENLSFEDPIKQTFYYRRKITETGSGTIGYSNIATINITLAFQTGSN